MKIKNIFASAIAGVSLLAFVGAASAGTTIYQTGTSSPTMPTADINVWGSSAQFTYWKREAPNYLQAAGCTNGVSGTTTDNKNFVQQANCGGTTVNFRVSSKASYDGPLAIDGNTTNPFASNTSCSSPYDRPMADPSSCSGGVCTSAALCVPVTIGASDVLLQDFTQHTTGTLNGPLGGASEVHNFLLDPVTVSSNVVDLCRPLAIPFSFYVNNSVLTSAGTVLNNLSTASAKMIFSGAVKDWSDLQGIVSGGTGTTVLSMPAMPINACFRAAGSGTLATLAAFMEPQTLLTTQISGGTGYHAWFNDGSADMMNCVNGSGTWSGTGAVGFADVDQNLANYGNTTRLSLDNQIPYTPLTQTWTNPFMTIENVYVSLANSTNPLYLDICTYSDQPSTVEANNIYWAAQCHMQYVKQSNFSGWSINTNYQNSNCN